MSGCTHFKPENDPNSSIQREVERSYFSNGNSSYPKETIEIFSEEQIVKIVDFEFSQIYTPNGIKKFRTKGQDKGFNLQLESYMRFLKGESRQTMSLGEILDSSLITFEIIDKLKE